MLRERGPQPLEIASRSVTGPRRATPSVAYAKRTSRSPLPVSSSCTSDANRLSPACWGSFSSSSRVAAPQGVAARVSPFFMPATLRRDP